jgi:nitrogen-specific signal transduction histidine kinase
MDEPAGDNEAISEFYVNTLRVLRHDIKNQLSNIHLALEQLRYELPEVTEDCIFYMDLISKSSLKINALLKETE